MNFIINSGNTTTELAVFSGQELRSKEVFLTKNTEQIKHTINNQDAKKVMVSSTSSLPKKIVNAIEKKEEVYFMNHSLMLPFEVSYQSPESLGADRLAAVAGAWSMKKNTDLLVITAGTCITYNILTSEHVFMGGSISPGIDMRYQAMHHYTANLPLIQNESFDELIGRSTKESLLSGVRNGIVAELDGIISQYKLLYPTIEVLICGGSASFFERRTKNRIFAHQNLELFGLNELLNYNCRTE